MTKSRVMTALQGKHAQLRVEGRGTFETAASFRQACQQLLGRGANDFIIDLGSCEMLDSTFLGILVSCGLRLQQERVRARIMDASAEITASFKEVGLERLYEFDAPQPE